jgi:hypothetical protein
MIHTIRIRNRITDRVRIVEVSTDHPDDPAGQRAQHARHPPAALGLHGIVLDKFEEIVE